MEAALAAEANFPCLLSALVSYSCPFSGTVQGQINYADLTHIRLTRVRSLATVDD
jgi:hypothetical protein